MSSQISFSINLKPIQVPVTDPTQTLLTFLRRNQALCGTKEGCAEGDCGACTVVLAELSGGTVRYRAVNACILFVPTLHGKVVLTVEHLRKIAGGLHPVQQAMVDQHASQCGFCTPGFVMSLFAMYRTHLAGGAMPDDDAISDALTGNLCRCTGYRPILDAAHQLLEHASENASADAADEQAIYQWLSETAATPLYTMPEAARRYAAPAALADLAAYMQTHPQALMLGGGTDIGLWVNKQHQRPADIVYTGGVAELHRVERRADGALVIGGAATYSDVLPFLHDFSPALASLFLRIGSRQIRNSGTVAGNIANASPIGDTPPLLLVMNAQLELMLGNEQRNVALNDFFTGYRQHILRPGEFIRSIIVPQPDKHTTLAAYKLSKRFDQDISALCGAFAFQTDGKTVCSVRIAFGGMAERPKRAQHCEAKLTGQAVADIAGLIDALPLEQDFSPISDMRASAAYRMLSARQLLRRFTGELSGAPFTRLDFPLPANAL